MKFEDYDPDEIAARGKAIYKEKIRPLVIDTEKGKILVIDVESGDYEIDERDIIACIRLRERRPDAVIYGLRVGYRVAYSLGGGLPPEEE